MPEQIKFIKEILDHVESYKKDVGNTDIKEFAVYLRDKVFPTDNIEKDSSFNNQEYLKHKETPKVEFSILLTSLYRFARIYVKKAFKNTSIKTIDDFGFLASILKAQSLTKNELIRMHYMEVSSGSEILKRLIKKQLVKESPDLKDKRAKRVSLTEKGIADIMNAFNEMYKVSEIVAGNLSGDELKEALSTFNKLKFFHAHIQDEAKDENLETIHQKYIYER